MSFFRRGAGDNLEFYASMTNETLRFAQSDIIRFYLLRIGMGGFQFLAWTPGAG